jgi:hypothetical protein
MTYELMELSTGNLVGVYATLEQALDAVAESVRRFGPASVATLALGRNDAEGDGEIIAQGLRLLERAQLVI